jgi:hypothetical protein
MPDLRTRAGAAVAGLLCLAACGPAAAANLAGGPDPVPLHAAPEPAHAPPLRTAPAGTVIALPPNSSPEGAIWDPASGLVAVSLRAPDRLALIDAGRHQVERLLPIAASARHLELAGPGQLLAPGEDTNQVVEVALPSGTVTGTVRVRKQPHDVAVVGPTDWYVADEFGQAVSHVVSGQVVATFLGKLQPGGAGVAGDTGAVVDVRSRLLWLYRGGRQIGRLPAGVGPTHVIGIGGNQVVVTDTSGDQLLVYDIGGNPQLARRIPLAGKPYGTAFDARRNRLWITATGANLLIGYDVTPNGLVRAVSYPTVRDAYSVAVDSTSGTVVVVGESGAQLQFIHP